MTAVLAAVVLGSPLAGPGCRPRDTGAGEDLDPQAFAAAVASLTWPLEALAADPVAGERYELRAANPGAAAVRLGLVTAYLAVDLGAEGASPQSEAVPFPEMVAPAATVSAVLTLRSTAAWPDEFTVQAWLRPAAAAGDPVVATEKAFRPVESLRPRALRQSLAGCFRRPRPPGRDGPGRKAPPRRFDRVRGLHAITYPGRT